jgi:hypothetical protein
MTVKISFSDLWTYEGGDPHERLPLSRLAGAGEGHIHGRLKISIVGRELPYLGFFGPDDVCFNEWFRELHHLRRHLSESEISEYIYDEGEQGQPAFRFCRANGKLLISVIASDLSSAPGDENWMDVECEFGLFNDETASFEERFCRTLQKEVPHVAKEWLEYVLEH